jgi:hypothetical protein
MIVESFWQIAHKTLHDHRMPLEIPGWHRARILVYR